LIGLAWRGEKHERITSDFSDAKWIACLLIGRESEWEGGEEEWGAWEKGKR
jgi:hypothetical protein